MGQWDNFVPKFDGTLYMGQNWGKCPSPSPKSHVFFGKMSAINNILEGFEKVQELLWQIKIKNRARKEKRPKIHWKP
jgi:hypothetical protein